MIEKLRESTSGDYLELILYTGLRIGEVLALTWDDIDFEEKMLSVNKSLSKWIILPDGSRKLQKGFGTPKSKSGFRKIPLIPEAIALLKNAQEKQKQKLMVSGSENISNLVFCSVSGKFIDRGDAYGVLKRACKKAEISGVHPHTLRHTFATRGLERGIPLKIMQEILGHSTISMTADIYTHVLPDTKINSMMKLSVANDKNS